MIQETQAIVTNWKPERDLVRSWGSKVAWEAFSYYPPLQRTLIYVTAHFNAKLETNVVARVACLHPNYFSSYFHERVGLTYSEWLRLLRVARSVRLMAREDDSVSAVGAMVGFASRRSFERAFKAVTGKTPNQYKRQIRPFATLQGS